MNDPTSAPPKVPTPDSPDSGSPASETQISTDPASGAPATETRATGTAGPEAVAATGAPASPAPSPSSGTPASTAPAPESPASSTPSSGTLACEIAPSRTAAPELAPAVAASEPPSRIVAPGIAAPEGPSAGSEPEKIALFLLDIGSPSGPAEVAPFLRRLYGDPLAMRLPFGAETQKLFAAAVSLLRAPAARRALGHAGGSPPETAQLHGLARALCERLTDSRRLFVPFVALRHAAPSIADALRAAKAAGCRRIVGLGARPFAGPMASESARVELKVRAADDIEEIDPSTVDHWHQEPSVRAVWAGLTREALAALPEAEREAAHLLFTLQALPIEGSRDPALDEGRAFADAVLALSGLRNPYQVAYLDRTDPNADLLPGAAEAVDRLAREKCRALAVIPISHCCETLASVWEIDLLLRERARDRGIAHFARARCPGQSPDLAAALEGVLRRHLAEMDALRSVA